MDQGVEQVTAEMKELALFAAGRATEKLRADGEFAPFVVLVPAIGDAQEIIEFPEKNPEKLLAIFQEAVRDQKYQARLYAVCYDGYVRANGQDIDAVIVEFAGNTEKEAHAIGLPYCGEGDEFQIEEEATYLGDCPTHFFVAENEM